MPILSDPPVTTPIAGSDGLLSLPWEEWIVSPGQGNALGLREAVQQSVYQPVNSTETLTGQNAAIAATSFPLGVFPGGAVRVSWYLRVTTADGVASSVTVNFGFTEKDTNQGITASGAAWTVDSVSSIQSGTALLLTAAGSPITFSTNYSSTTAGKMHYTLMLTIELMS